MSRVGVDMVNMTNVMLPIDVIRPLIGLAFVCLDGTHVHIPLREYDFSYDMYLLNFMALHY